ncbi:hypothetical protein BH09PSE3_BH09PSE3_15990 [soil metagenome]
MHSAIEHPVIVDRSIIPSLLAGKKSQTRVLACSPLRKCRTGNVLWVKEPCAGGKIPPDQKREYFSHIRRAEFVVFLDGWRKFRSGKRFKAKKLKGRVIPWVPAMHMPRWASRMTLNVLSVHIAPLQCITRDEIVAEGQVVRIAGLYWRLAAPCRGVWLDPRHAYARVWNSTRTVPGERWEDNPLTAVINFRLIR